MATTSATPTREDIKQRNLRAREWRKFREENLITQQQLAEEMGVCKRTICSIENGEILRPSFRVLIKFRNCKQRIEARIAKGEPVWN